MIKSQMSVDLNKNRDSIVAAWKDVLDDKTNTDWALFGYEGQTNDLQFISKGDGGIEELKEELNSGKIMYAFLRVLDPKTSLPKCVLIIWQGEGAPQVRKGTCANHIRDVKNLLHGAHVTINARNEEEVEEDVILDKVSKCTGSAYSFKERIGDVDRQTAPVGTVYKRVIPKNEINTLERDKFWQKEEEEEKQRLAEERKRRELLKQAQKEQQEREAEQILLESRSSPEMPKHIKDSVQKEAEDIIKTRNFDARAMFEKNTSAGQLHSRRSSDAIMSSGVDTVGKIPSWPPQDSPQETKIQVTPQPVKCYSEIVEDRIQQAKPAQVEEDINPNEPEQDIGDNLINGATVMEEYEDLGLRAEALYDYQAADETEISFDPGDIITHIDQIDAGWWQGLGPDGFFGLFPANYVQLLPD